MKSTAQMACCYPAGPPTQGLYLFIPLGVPTADRTARQVANESSTMASPCPPEQRRKQGRRPATWSRLPTFLWSQEPGVLPLRRHKTLCPAFLAEQPVALAKMTREQRAQWVGAARLRSCAVARHTTSSEACVSSGRGLWLSICHLIRRCVVPRKYGFLSGKFERRRWDCTRAVATHAGRSCGAVARRKRDAASHDALEHGSTACNQGRPRDEIGLMACPHRHQTAPSAACIPVTDTGRRLLLLRGRVGGNAPRAAGYSSDARSSAAPAVAMQEVPIPVFPRLQSLQSLAGADSLPSGSDAVTLATIAPGTRHSLGERNRERAQPDHH